MNLVKKFSVFALMIATVVSMSGGLTVKAAGNYNAGSLLAKANTPGAAVYYIGSDGMKYVFPDVKTYNTWYENFDNVVKVSVSELDMYPDGGAVTYREGSYLVTHADTAKVYAVEPGGTLRWVPTAETAAALYGANWGAKVRDVIPGFFSSSYTLGSDLGSTLPTGTIAMEQGGTTYYRIEGTTKRPFASMDAFEANNFNLDFVVTADLSAYTSGTSITGQETALSGFMPSDDEVVTPVDGNLTVSLAATTPAAQSIPTGSPNDFFAFRLAAGSTAVSIESITLTSFGLGTAQEIDDITLYQDGVKLGTSKDINSDKEATFNFSTPLAISANSSMTIVAKATLVGASASETYGLKIASASDVVTGGSVGGSFPVSGNLMTAVSADIGMATITSATDDSSITANFGEDDVMLAEFTLTTSSTEPILWETITFRNGGTNNADVVSNMRIEVDGDVVDEGASLSDKYVNFDMGSLLIAKGTAVNVVVYGDIGVASVGNTVDLYLDNAADFGLVGQDYGYGIAPNIPKLDAAGDGITVTLAAGDFTIDMDKTATPNKDVRGGDDDVVLATISFTSNGENATINDISDTSGSNGDFYIQGSGLEAGEASNFELRDISNGVIYDITETVSTTLAGWTLAMTDEINLVSGVTKTFELRVDLSGPNDSTPIDSTNTLKVYLEGSAINVTGDDSDAAITDITPSSISGSTATVRAGALTVSTVTLTSKSVVGGAGSDEPIIVYKAGLEVGESSDLTLSTVRIDVDDTEYTSFTDNNIAQLDLYLVSADGQTEKLLKSTSNSITNDGATTGYINFTGLNSTNRVLTAGEDYFLVVKAIFASTLADGTTFALESVDTASYIVVVDEDSVGVVEALENAETNSRLITVATVGTLKAEIITTDSSANNDFYILAGTETTDNYLAEIKFTTANEAIELTNLALENYGDAQNDDIDLVKLYNEAGEMVAYKSPSVGGHVHFEAADFIDDANILPADEATSFFLGISTKSMNALNDAAGTADFDEAVQYAFASTTSVLTTLFGLAAGDAVKATGVDSAGDVTTAEDPTTSGDAAVGQYSHSSIKSKTASTTGSILTMVTNDKVDATLSGGTSKIVGEYKFIFDNGSNRTTTNLELKAQLRTLILNVATSSGVVASNFKAYIEGDAANKTDAVQPVGAAQEVTLDLTTLDTDTNLVDGTVTLVIIADLTVTGADQYVQTEIDDLTTDFTYNGNHGLSGSNWSNALIEGISDVPGATLSN